MFFDVVLNFSTSITSLNMTWVKPDCAGPTSAGLCKESWKLALKIGHSKLKFKHTSWCHLQCFLILSSHLYTTVSSVILFQRACMYLYRNFIRDIFFWKLVLVFTFHLQVEIDLLSDKENSHLLILTVTSRFNENILYTSVKIYVARL